MQYKAILAGQKANLVSHIDCFSIVFLNEQPNLCFRWNLCWFQEFQIWVCYSVENINANVMIIESSRIEERTRQEKKRIFTSSSV